MMIRPCENTEKLVEIWLSASLPAHDFVPAETWTGARDSMRNDYLPHSENYAYTDDISGEIEGFISLSGSRIEALFVAPQFQGHGVGGALLAFAGELHEELTLSVYEKNTRAVRFYTGHGFRIMGSGICPFTGERELFCLRRSE